MTTQHSLGATHQAGWRESPETRCPAAHSQAPGHLAATDSGETAVLIVDHGSRRPESNAMLDNFADLYREHSGRGAVRAAHMELAEPSILTAVTALAEEGYRDVVIAPYFFSPGRHITQDIPALMTEAQQANPGVTIKLADPIGLEPLMAEIIEQRVAKVLSQSPNAEPIPATAITLEKE